MTEILRLLFKFESEYKGDPRFIMGNALRHALSLQLDASIGIFTDVYRLSLPRTYQDYFAIRTKKCLLHPHFEFFLDQVRDQRKFRCFFTPQCVTFDVLEPPENLIELIKSVQPFQLGGARNYGFGAVKLRDSLSIDVDELELIEKASHLTLIAPIVHVPSIVEKYHWRHENILLWNNGKSNSVHAVAPGQFFRLKQGVDVQKIAREGILRREKAHKRLLGQFGFGEFMLHDWKKQGG
ncbi:MAG: hypothetical protein HWN65_12770 [Candidatus Helarchaeota archaeon]|nr:hypothetical protein [Candidatus Helarchaeota archaeon]